MRALRSALRTHGTLDAAERSFRATYARITLWRPTVPPPYLLVGAWLDIGDP
jgi:hypothetical protein